MLLLTPKKMVGLKRLNQATKREFTEKNVPSDKYIEDLQPQNSCRKRCWVHSEKKMVARLKFQEFTGTHTSGNGDFVIH